MSKLQPCPFCGEQVFTPLVASLDDGYTRCGFCGAKMQHRRWQTRPIEDDLRNRIAELDEQIWTLNLENERMEEAYWIDESIAPDGTLKPSVRKLLERLEKAETDLRLSDDLVKALDNRIAELEEKHKVAFGLVRELRRYCIYAHWNNPDVEDEFNEFDEEICKYISEYKEREE